MRVGATSDDPLVQVTAFYDETNRTEAVVLINNAATSRNVGVAFGGLLFSGALRGEQSSGNVRWQPIAAVTPIDARSFFVQLPPHSVTSVGGAF